MQETAAIHPAIFRAYDIRGIVGKELTEDNVYLLGRAIASLVIENGEKRIALGRDGRLSGPLLSQALSKWLQASGCDVIDLGVVPTPLLYYATHVLDTRS